MNSFAVSLKGFAKTYTTIFIFKITLSIEYVLVAASEIATINWFVKESCIS